jgi:hypothetical protein
MNDADKILSILVKIGKVDEADLPMLKRQIEEVGQNTEELSKKTEHSAEATKGHAANSRELHKVMHALNEIVPGLGTALKIAFHPTSIGIVGTLVAFEGLKSVLESMKEIDSIPLTEFTGNKEAIEAVKAAYEKAELAAKMFVTEQNRINVAGATAEEIAKRQIQNYSNLAEAQKQFNEAQKNLSESQIEKLENHGLISHAEALKRKFALDVEYAKKRLQLETETAKAELAAKAKQLETERSQLAQAKQDQTTDEANAAAATAVKDRHEKQKDAAKENIESANKTLEELGKSHGSVVQGIFNEETAQKLEEYYQKYIGDPAGKRHSEMFAELEKKKGQWSSGASWSLDFTKFMDHTIGRQEGEVGWAKFDDARQQIESAKKEISALEKSQFQVDLNAERSKKQLDATDDAVRKLSESVQKLAAEIPQQKADNAAKLNNEAATQNLELRATAAKLGLHDPGNIFKAAKNPVISTASTDPGNQTPWRYDFGNHPKAQIPSPEAQARADFATAEHALDTFRSGKKIDANQTAQLKHIAEMMAGHELRSEQVMGVLSTMLANQKSKDAAFTREIENIKRQMRHN